MNTTAQADMVLELHSAEARAPVSISSHPHPNYMLLRLAISRCSDDRLLISMMQSESEDDLQVSRAPDRALTRIRLDVPWLYYVMIEPRSITQDVLLTAEEWFECD